MLNHFLNKANFRMDWVVRAHITSESLLWSAWNFVAPIAAIFVTTNIKGGTAEVAATAYSIYLLVRVLLELVSGNYLSRKSDSVKFRVSAFGIFLMSIAYTGFAFSSDILHVMLFYMILGLGLGIATPAKNSLFSNHLDKNKESSEWGYADAAIFTCMALAGVIGGFIATKYGFKMLFLVAAAVNLLATLPYLIRPKR